VPGDRARTVEIDGVRLDVREWAGGGEDVLLIHGLASPSHIWDLVAPRLVRLGLHPVAYDQRGHGRSSKPSSGYGFDRTTADAAAVIRATRLHRPIVVGHSWGANVALELAIRRSRLVGGTVLLDGGFITMRERLDWTTAKRTLSPPSFGGITVDAFLSRVHRNLGRTIPITPQLDEIFLSLVRVDAAGRVRPRLSRANHLKILRSLWEQDTIGLLERARVPTLILAARSRSGGSARPGFERDKAFAARRAQTIGPPVSFEWIQGIHDVPLQRPEAVARRIAGSPWPRPAFGAGARRMVPWRCSC
jgi:pimeloyl-ACP methyl ester carboxylesterase